MTTTSKVGFITADELRLIEPEYYEPPPVIVMTFGKSAIDPADMPTGKTPISLLDECCKRKSVVLRGQLVGDVGDVTDRNVLSGPSFTFSYDVDGITATGRAKNKKTAKHLAALRILEQIVRLGRYVEFGIPGRNDEEALEYIHSLMPELATLAPTTDGAIADGSGAGDGATVAAASIEADNPVGKLNERCLKLRLDVPLYDVIDETGQPNEKVFVIGCRVGEELQTQGDGRNKKAAKRLAAIAMLKLLESLPGNGNPMLTNDIDPIIADNATVDSVITKSPTTAHQTNGNSFANNIGKELTLFDDGVINDSTACLVKFLCDTKQAHAEPVYDVYDRKDCEGRVQCTLQLNLNPPAVFQGSGIGIDEAKQSAARDAITYLSTMTTDTTTATSMLNSAECC